MLLERAAMAEVKMKQAAMSQAQIAGAARYADPLLPGGSVIGGAVSDAVGGVVDGLKKGPSEATLLDRLNMTPMGMAARAGASAMSGWKDSSAQRQDEAGQAETAPLPPAAPVQPLEKAPDLDAGLMEESKVYGAGKIGARQVGYLDTKQVDAAAAQEKAAVLALEEARAKEADEIVAQRVLEEQAARKYAQITAERESVLTEELNQASMRVNNAAAELEKIDPSIDPRRYWASKDTGQKISGFIAAACFGFAGKGMDFLSMVQQEIDRDIDVQKATFAQKKALAEGKIQGAQTSYNMVMAKVGHDRASRLTVHNAALSAIGKQIETIKATHASPQIRANAAVIAAQIEGRRAANSQEIAKVNSTIAAGNADRWQRAEMNNAQMEMRRRDLELKARKSAMEKLPTYAFKAIEQGSAGINLVLKTRQLLEKTKGLKASFFSSMPDAAVRAAAAAGNANAQEYLASQAQLTRLASQDLRKAFGALTKHDEPRLAKYASQGLSAAEELETYLNAVQDELVNQYNYGVKVAKDLGHTSYQTFQERGENAGWFASDPFAGGAPAGGQPSGPVAGAVPFNETPASAPTQEPQRGGDL